MDDLLLQNIQDVFQIEGRGTVVTGEIGPGWKTAKRGEKIELRTPGGGKIKTAIKDMELFTKGRLDRGPSRHSAALLQDVVASDQIPRGTEMWRRLDDASS